MNRMAIALSLCAPLILLFNCGARSDSAPRSVGQAASDRPLLSRAAQTLAVGGAPAALALGDTNGDGILDLIVGHGRDNGLVVMLGDGRGGFTPAPGSPFDAGMPAHRIAIGDVNHDRLPDVALTNHDSLNVAVMLGQRGGGFALAPGSPFAALKSGRAHNHGVAFADVNEDGHLDITTSNNNDNSVSVLLGDGKGRFTPAANSPITVASRPFYVAVADFDGDGHPDLAATHDDINLLTILLGDGRGGFSAARGSPLDLGRRAYQLVAADMDGDEKTDLVVSM